MIPISIVIFAQVPPPDHGQSRMVRRTLDALLSDPERFEVHHVNARFSETLEDVGASSFSKLGLSIKYLVQALRLRTQINNPILLYVPGPVKWSAVLRDWLLLGILRLFYRRVVFHWHAIGHGEWANGSSRLALSGPTWLDSMARFVSRQLLDQPYSSFSVSASSRNDALAVSSLHELVVPNGIQDPCPDFDSTVKLERVKRLQELKSDASPCFRILFLSRGTEEKGLFDALEALRLLIASSSVDWKFEVTFAGGLDHSLEDRFKREIAELEIAIPKRLRVRLMGYVSGEEKSNCYVKHDLFLSPSRWESFGLTVLEAMAFGMRVVAASSDGVQGVLPPSYPWLAPVSCPDILAKILQGCCEDMLKDQNAREGCELRARFLEHFQLKDFSHNLKKAFIEIGKHSGNFDSLEIKPSTNIFREQRSCISESQDARQRSWREVTGKQPCNIPTISLSVYLADQTPKLGRSLGISRMTDGVLGELQKRKEIALRGVASLSSIRMPDGIACKTMPWNTRNLFMRVLSDHIHPLFDKASPSQVCYYPKGFLPALSALGSPSVVTIHDTIVQYYAEHYPAWRSRLEYAYWAAMLKHTLTHASHVLTVSQESKRQIIDFMLRHQLPPKEITVTYEPCLYENIPQPVDPVKESYVLHLSSLEPHKKTAWLVDFWLQHKDDQLPVLHVVGTLPKEVRKAASASERIRIFPFLDDADLRAQFEHARALVFPSEIEGFGLPAIEAYYLGTPVCFVKGTSVEEVLSVATDVGGFDLTDPSSFVKALDQVLALPAEEVHRIGLRLRETYAAKKVVDRMCEVFQKAAQVDGEG